MFRLIRRVRDKFRRQPTVVATPISAKTTYGYGPVNEDSFIFGSLSERDTAPVTDGMRAARAFHCIFATKDQRDLAVRFFHQAKKTAKYNPGLFYE